MATVGVSPGAAAPVSAAFGGRCDIHAGWTVASIV
jgi:hypothetical protein